MGISSTRTWTSEALEFAPELGKHTGTDYFLERRELGLINIGGDAVVTVDGVNFDVKPDDALYVGKGARTVRFASAQIEPLLLSLPWRGFLQL